MRELISQVVPYQALSRVYDRWNVLADHAQIAEYVGRHARPTRPTPRVLDLCAGTGSLAILLAKQGYEVVGLDRSAEMIEVARRKLAASPIADRVTLRAGDVLREEWPEAEFDVVTCTLDSVNHFGPHELGPLFRRVSCALGRPGTLIFDFNSEYKLAEVFGNSRYGESHTEYAYVWKNTLSREQRSIRFDITLFTKDSNSDCYRRYEETHVQHIHRVADVAAVLESAGFSRVSFCDDYSDRVATARTQRITVCAHRA